MRRFAVVAAGAGVLVMPAMALHLVLTLVATGSGATRRLGAHDVHRLSPVTQTKSAKGTRPHRDVRNHT